MGGSEAVPPSGRLRYSREEVFSLKEASALIDFPINPVPLKPSRPNRKKSQSVEADANIISENGHAAADGQGGLRRIRLWHPNAGRGHGQQSAGVASFHHRQRYPSGPHGDTGEADSAATFRPVSTDKSRGNQGDWSKGCAGWRQRSYSGSESFGLVMGPNYARGRGMVPDSAADGEYHGHRGRGTGRIRGATQRGALMGSRRPVSFVHDSNSNFNLEKDFWQEDDWKSMELDVGSNPKSKHRADWKPFAESFMEKNVTKGVANMRIHSKSCSIDPPPGFEQPLHSQDPSCSDPNSAETSAKMDSSVAETDTQWYYIDSSGHTQGPFGNEQMATWLTKGYLPLQIEVRRDRDECFLPLLNHLALAGRIPFWRGYSQSPITRANLASVLIASGSPLSSPLWINQPPIPKTSTESAGGVVRLHETVQTSSTLDTVGVQQTSDCPSQQLEQCNIPTFSVDATQGALIDSAGEQLPNSSSSNPLIDNTEILRLCTEAQVLAIHAAKVEAERQELAERLTAISSTAAKLLADPLPQSSSAGRTQNSPTHVSSAPPPPGWTEETGHVAPTCPVELTTVPESMVEPEVDVPVTTGDDSSPSGVQHDVSTISAQERDQPHPELTDVKKSKKKNKKAKKGKLTQEQERQLAWDAEFERRKAAALEKRLAEEEEERRVLEEQKAAAAEAQAAIAMEKKRLLAEQRKQEALKSKAEKELAQLKLPRSARWGTSGDPGGPNTPVGLADIQAAQAVEEAERASQQFVARQAALLAEAETRATAKSRPTAWASVVGGDNRMNQQVDNKTAHFVRTPASSKVVDFPGQKASKADKTADSQPSASGQHSKTNTGKAPSNNTMSQSKDHSSTGVSIWDLPRGTKNDTTQPKNKNAKKSKKKQNAAATQPNDEAKTFAAKEQLAHWCESQLSSMPLSGVDLPTLVDLLCELETADQVTEFIETSLGRSALTMKFSKAFLEKRACILNAVL